MYNFNQIPGKLTFEEINDTTFNEIPPARMEIAQPLVVSREPYHVKILKYSSPRAQDQKLLINRKMYKSAFSPIKLVVFLNMEANLQELFFK